MIVLSFRKAVQWSVLRICFGFRFWGLPFSSQLAYYYSSTIIAGLRYYLRPFCLLQDLSYSQGPTKCTFPLEPKGTRARYSATACVVRCVGVGHHIAPSFPALTTKHNAGVWRAPSLSLTSSYSSYPHGRDITSFLVKLLSSQH